MYSLFGIRGYQWSLFEYLKGLGLRRIDRRYGSGKDRRFCMHFTLREDYVAHFCLYRHMASGDDECKRGRKHWVMLLEYPPVNPYPLRGHFIQVHAVPDSADQTRTNKALPVGQPCECKAITCSLPMPYLFTVHCSMGRVSESSPAEHQR